MKISPDLVPLLQGGLDQMEQGIAIFDRTLKLVAWNHAYKTIADMPDSIVREGISIEDQVRFKAEAGYYGDGDADQAVRECMLHFEQRPRQQFDWQRPDGRIVEVKHIRTDQGGLISTYSDVTERVKSVESACQSESQLLTIADNVPVLIAFFDSDSTIRFANKTACRWLDAPRDKLIGTDVDNFIASRAPREMATRWHALLDQQKKQSFEQRLKWGDGEVRDVLVQFIPHSDDSNTFLGGFILCVDFTLHREAENRLHQAQAIKSVGQLSGGIAHQFNNLLAIISGHTELLAESLSPTSPLTDSTRAVLKAASRGAALVDHLLAFSERRTGAISILKPDSFLPQIVPILRRTVGEQTAIEFNGGDSDWRVRVDAEQLEDALVNLALNAAAAMTGGGKIVIASDSRHFSVDDLDSGICLAPGDYLVISVTDTGHGMSPDVLKQAFTPFFTTRDVGQAAGLGLSMVYGFAEQAGGTATIDSLPDQGTTVTLWLPRTREADDSVQREATAKPASKPGRDGEVILVVEDDQDIRGIAMARLAGLGYQPLEAHDADHALDLLKKRRDIALLFADVVLPGSMNGPELAEKARSGNPALKILFTSGFGGFVDSGSTFSPTPPMLPKPYRAQELAQSIKTALKDDG